MRICALFAFIITACWEFSHAQVEDFHSTNFGKADSVAGMYAAHSLYDLRGLAVKLTAPLSTEQEKFRAIYEWVCSNIEVDYNLVVLNKRQRAKLHGEKFLKWSEKFNRTVFEKLLQERQTLCTGYAYTIRALCFHAGLSCEIIYGYANPRGVAMVELPSVNHSWNKIRLNGKWYVCDATWSSGIVNPSSRQFIKRYNDKYFLPDPSVFAIDHASF